MAETETSETFSDGENLGELAIALNFGAGFVIPTALKLAAESVKSKADPAQVARAADDWFEACEHLVEAADETRAVDEGLADEDWRGTDRDEFSQVTGRFAGSSDMHSVLALYVGMALYVSAVMVYIKIMMLFLAGTILAVFALLILACRAAYWAFGAGAVAEAKLQATANSLAATFQTNVTLVDQTFTALQVKASAGMAAMTGVDIVGQVFTGNFGALLDLGGAVGGAIGDVLKGSLEKLGTELMAAGVASKLPIGIGVGGVQDAEELDQPEANN